MAYLRILYTSIPTYPIGEPADFEIFQTAKVANSRNKITGFLARSQTRFFQYIEGEPAAIETLYDAIKRDPRNEKCRLKMCETGSNRLFEEWQMGYFAQADAVAALPSGPALQRAVTLPEGSKFLQMLSLASKRESLSLQTKFIRYVGPVTTA